MEGACSELSLINLSCLIPFPTEVILGALGYEKEKKKKRNAKSRVGEHQEGLWTPDIAW